jgi:hypothetical protein
MVDNVIFTPMESYNELVRSVKEYYTENPNCFFLMENFKMCLSITTERWYTIETTILMENFNPSINPKETKLVRFSPITEMEI